MFAGVFVSDKAAAIVAAGDFGRKKDKRAQQQWRGSSCPGAAAGLDMSKAAGVAAAAAGAGASAGYGGDAGSAVDVRLLATGAASGLCCWSSGRPLCGLLGDIASLELQEQPWTRATDNRKRDRACPG